VLFIGRSCINFIIFDNELFQLFINFIFKVPLFDWLVVTFREALPVSYVCGKPNIMIDRKCQVQMVDSK
jgi:hypothetical protein